MSQSQAPTQTAHAHLQLELDKLKACIHCGLCLPACPTYQATGSEAESPRGRLYLMKKLLDAQITDVQARPHLDQCLACHGCESVCPSGVQYGRILLGSREDLAVRDNSLHRHFKRWVFQHVLPRHGWLLLFGRLLRGYQQSGLQAWVQKSGILKLLPALARQEQLLPELPPHQALPAGMTFGDAHNETVALLTGCVMDVFYNPVHWDTIAVLTANGYRVSIPEQTCCGALAHHAGETDITRHLARKNIDTILKDNPSWIVLNSAGCGSSLKDYGHLLAHDPAYAEKARIFSEKVVDVLALLAKKPLAPMTTPVSQTVTYHAACHLHHVQKVQTQPMDLLGQVPGLALVPLVEMASCCGSAGIFNLEHPELSAEILAEKMRHLQTACKNQGAQTVATGNPGCILQLAAGIRAAGLPMQVKHPISILAEAYRGGSPA